MTLASFDQFQNRHLGPRKNDVDVMLQKLGINSLDQLMDEAIPQNIRLQNELDLPEAETEQEFLARLKTIAEKNKIYKSFIRIGYYGTHTPSVILRNVFEDMLS